MRTNHLVLVASSLGIAFASACSGGAGHGDSSGSAAAGATSGSAVCQSSVAGYYCGSDQIAGGSPDTLYECKVQGGAAVPEEVCAHGCHPISGQADVCNPDCSKATQNGLWCGNDRVDGTPSALYDCENGQVNWAKSTKCPGGTCNNGGQNSEDYCSGGPGGGPEPCGAVLTSLDGVDVHSNGGQQGSGNCCTEPDGSCATNSVGQIETGYQWQCVEFAQRYFYEVYGIVRNGSAMWATEYAKDMCGSTSLPAGVTSYIASSANVPSHGDLFVKGMSSGDPDGHVAVVDYVSGDTVYVVEQNASWSGRNSYPLGEAVCFLTAKSPSCSDNPGGPSDGGCTNGSGGGGSGGTSGGGGLGGGGGGGSGGSGGGGSGGGGSGGGGSGGSGGGVYAFVKARPSERRHEVVLAEGASEVLEFTWSDAAGMAAPSDLTVEANGRTVLQVFSNEGEQPLARVGLNVVPLSADTPYRLVLQRDQTLLRATLEHSRGTSAETVVGARIEGADAVGAGAPVASVVLPSPSYRACIVADGF